MGEKGGGRGFSIPNSGAKTSLKSTPLSGKDDTSANSKRGRKVSFSPGSYLGYGLSPKSSGKNDFGTAKGGKGSSQLNGGTAKAPQPKEPPELDLRVEQELPKNAKCLMDCEAAEILEGIREHLTMLSEDPTIIIPKAFDKGLQYAKSSSLYTNPQSVRNILQKLKDHGVSDGEVCMIANISSVNVDEIFDLVPTLKVYNFILKQYGCDVLKDWQSDAKESNLRDPLNSILKELAKLKRPRDIPDIY